jgi:RelE-like HigB toxin of type II HigAB toxin-antitoxin system
MLHAAERLTDLRVPPGNRLHQLERDRAGQHSISINDQWRICFVWRDGDAYNVEITDYHGGRKHGSTEANSSGRFFGKSLCYRFT